MKNFNKWQPQDITIDGRELPKNAAVEKEFLTTLLSTGTNGYILSQTKFLTPEVFTDERRKAIFAALLRCKNTTETPNALDVIKALTAEERQVFMDENEISNFVGVAKNETETIKQAKYLYDLFVKRNYLTTFTTAVTDIYKGIDISEISENVVKNITTSRPTRNIKYKVIKPNDNIKEVEAVLSQGENRIMSVGDVSVVCGQPKSRKTFLIAAVAAAYLSDEGYMGLSSSTDGNVILFDTEQNEYHVRAVVRRIYRLLQWDFNDKHENLNVISMRELSPRERITAVENAIKDIKPKFVLLDGFADLLANTNDIEESTARVADLMRLSSQYACHICSVVHTNPSSEKMRGHVGSELQRKAETVLLVTKSEEITTVSPQFCRNIEFHKFAFRVDDSGLPVPCEYVQSADDNRKVLFENIFFGCIKLSYAELRKEVMNKCNVKERAAERRIMEAVRTNIIKKKADGTYCLYYDENEQDRDLPEI